MQKDEWYVFRGSLNGKLQFEKWQNITRTDFFFSNIFFNGHFPTRWDPTIVINADVTPIQ